MTVSSQRGWVGEDLGNRRWIGFLPSCQAVLLAGLLVGGAAVRWTLPSLPFADPDSWGYVGPVVRAHLEGHFVQVFGRSFLYPSFVRAILGLTGSFSAVVSVQHAIGLVGGLLFWAAWNESRRLLPSFRLVRAGHALCGLVALGCYLLNNELIFYEHSLRPEAVFPAAASLTLWLVVRAFTREPMSAAFARNCAGVAGMHAFLFFLHPSFGLAAIGCILPVWGRAWVAGMPFRRLVLLAATLPVTFAVLHFAERATFAEQDLQGKIFGPMELFSFNADVVTLEIDYDRAHPDEAAYPAELLDGCSQLLHANFESVRIQGRPDPSLAYYPDALLYNRASVCFYLFDRFKEDPRRLNRFFMHYFLRGVWRHPGMYLSKIGRSLAVAYGPAVSLVSYVCADKIDVPYELDYTRDSLFKPRPQMFLYPPGASYAAALALTPREPQKLDAHWAQSTLSRLQPFYRPLLVASLGIFVACALGQSVRVRSLRSHAFLTATLFSYNFFICLTVGMINVMDNVRYSQNQIAFTIFALFSGAMLLCHAISLLLPSRAADPMPGLA